MTRIAESTRITLKSVLYLTDFSEASDAALPLALAIASNYGAKVHALHVLTPMIPEACLEAIRADEKLANAEMAKVDFRLTGVVHDTAVVRAVGVWPAVEQAIRERKIDLIVLGTHGRTHAQKLLLGSFAEEILRRPERACTHDRTACSEEYDYQRRFPFGIVCDRFQQTVRGRRTVCGFAGRGKRRAPHFALCGAQTRNERTGQACDC